MGDPTRQRENDTGIELRLPGLPVPSESPVFSAVFLPLQSIRQQPSDSQSSESILVSPLRKLYWAVACRSLTCLESAWTCSFVIWIWPSRSTSKRPEPASLNRASLILA